MKNASAAQARLIAKIWSSGSTTPVWSASPPTVLACMRNRWLIKNGIDGKFASGVEYSEYTVGEHGLLALEQYLRDTRLTKAFAERTP